MKHRIFVYALLSAMLTVPVSGIQAQQKAGNPQAEAAAKKKAEAEAKKQEQARKKAEAEAKRKAEAEAKRLAAEKKRAEAEAKRKLEAAYNAQNRELSKAFDALYKKRMTYADRIAELKKLLEDPINAEPRLQLRLYEQIINYCQQPPWTHIAEYDYELANVELVPAAMSIIGNAVYTPSQKFKACKALAFHYCNQKQFDKAVKLLRLATKQENIRPNDVGDYLCELANVYRLNDQYDEAMAVCHEVIEMGQKQKGANTGAMIAIRFGKLDEADAILDEIDDEFNKLKFYSNIYQMYHLRDHVRADALKFVQNLKNDPKQRWEIGFWYLFDQYRNAEYSAARRSLTGLPAQLKIGGWQVKNAWMDHVKSNDYVLIAEMAEIFVGSQILNDPAVQESHIVSVAALGRKEEAAKLAVMYAATEKIKPADQLKFLFYAAILTGKDTDKYLKDFNAPRKDQAEAVRAGAQQCQVWNMPELAEKLSADYEKYFIAQPNRVMEVKYFDTPVKSFADWRKIYSQLDRQMCDIPFKGSMDFLETDVATGNRTINFEENSKNTDAMEVSAACDKTGLHIFLRVKSDKARSIEHGFTGGIGTEMYFAPGRNQPYICMGSDPKSGVTFMFQTSYTNLNHKRPDMAKSKTSFYDEVEFTDSDYVLHMFFAWDDYCNKLPANGSEYRFECISWRPDGGFSWGGSQGVHANSQWGSLRFNLTDKQLNAIRRELIFKTFKTYKSIRRDPGVTENLFDIWADPVIGDPEFYKAKLIPLKEELDGYAKMVKEDMTDAEVAEFYSKAMPRMTGLKHVVDQLRREYLTEKLGDPEK